MISKSRQQSLGWRERQERLGHSRLIEEASEYNRKVTSRRYAAGLNRWKRETAPFATVTMRVRERFGSQLDLKGDERRDGIRF